MRRGRTYDDALADTLRYARLIDKRDDIARILIHLDRQTPPSEFALYGKRVVPFYNYLQASFVLEEDALLPAAAVIRVAVELAIAHRFDGEALARSYLELARRGHLRGTGAPRIAQAYVELKATAPLPGEAAVARMCERIGQIAAALGAVTGEKLLPDYLKLVDRHNRRRRTAP
jgi:hypothetical protein